MRQKFPLLFFLLPLLVLACSNPVVEISQGSPQTFDSWLVSTDATGIPTMTKTVSGSAFQATVNFTGEEAAINDLLSGAWAITVGLPDGEELGFSEKDNNVTARTKEVSGATFTVSVQPISAARATGIGGYLVAGSWMAMTRTGVWWGMNAWTEPSSGNVDLEMYRASSSKWLLVDHSRNPGLTMDSVADNPGWWWYDFMLKILAPETSTFTGTVSW